MPIPTVNCVICGKEVTKRQTIAIDSGRACRDHDEVKEHQKREVKQVKPVSKSNDGLNWLRVESFVSGIRMLAYQSGMSPLTLFLIRSEAIPGDIREDVRVELGKRGAITDSEMADIAMNTALMLMRKVECGS